VNFGTLTDAEYFPAQKPHRQTAFEMLASAKAKSQRPQPVSSPTQPSNLVKKHMPQKRSIRHAEQFCFCRY
jgi:hypothetical protein